MIRCRLYVEQYGWTVWAYFAKSTYYADEIMENLVRIGVRGEDAYTAYENLRSGALDTGLTYSGYARRESVMVVGLTSSPAEFMDSFVHEMGHLTAQMAEALGLDHMGEEVRYLGGWMAKRMFGAYRPLLCAGFAMGTVESCGVG